MKIQPMPQRAELAFSRLVLDQSGKTALVRLWTCRQSRGYQTKFVPEPTFWADALMDGKIIFRKRTTSEKVKTEWLKHWQTLATA